MFLYTIEASIDRVRLAEAPEPARVARPLVAPAAAVALAVGFGRIVASETEAPNFVVYLV